ncbi:MAG: hypothetical protein ABI785_13030 [Gemmatimonadales bacterium]
MTLAPLSRLYLLLLIASGAGACSGLVAGPESTSVTPIPASRDSAYVRARRALQGESFTLDVVDSAGGRLTGTRWPSASARQGTAAACHVSVALQVRGDNNQSEVSSTSRWVAPGGMSDKAPTVCETERSQVLDRTAQVLAPGPTP